MTKAAAAQQMTLRLCTTCSGDRDRPAERDAIAQALREAGLQDRVELLDHECFSACAHPVSISLQGEGRASYVFAGLTLIEDARDVAATCQTYLDSPGGWIEDARPCGRLRLCLRARIPAL
ncbi:hypothetical protein TRL7639_03018 [Falsiruegeria litorea R37]|uniref:Metal-binding protein n=1 Tax=Falsiruegeria litorea R37 TaxID=1200284 RepID=A0A1Y5TB17_9RHOB|nr:DUF1636 domain-containing protein [Falsiruegeria litorea]SLN56358.1 hypothetical protein TRL7639_03018 [Falsiruegeria litorea R37]